jgi:aspartyl-tRNA(Asn)/glutamyl-tRNA(Gln) amidotransferase subunit C
MELRLPDWSERSAIICLVMSLSTEEVRHIAKLARLKLSAEEESRFQHQLSDILDYAQRLQEVETDHIPPTSSVLKMTAPLRPDKARPCPPRADILSNAADAENGMFRVPPVLEEPE